METAFNDNFLSLACNIFLIISSTAENRHLSSSTSKQHFQCLPLFNDIYFSYSALFCSFCFSSDLYIEQILCKGTWRAVSLLVSLIFYWLHHSAASTFFYIRQHKLLQPRRNTSGDPTLQGRHVCLHDGESHAGNQSLQEAPFVHCGRPHPAPCYATRGKMLSSHQFDGHLLS